MVCSIGCSLADDGTGVFVQSIEHGGPAHLSGRIAIGDYIESIEGIRSRSLHDISEGLYGPPGTLVSVKIRRGGETGGDTETVHLARQHSSGQVPTEDVIGIAAALRVIPEGVRIDQVIPGGPAWISGEVKTGSVVTAVDGVNVVGGHFHPNEITAMIRGAVGTRMTVALLPDGIQPFSATASIPIHVELIRLWIVEAEAVSRYRERLVSLIASHEALLSQGYGGASSSAQPLTVSALRRAEPQYPSRSPYPNKIEWEPPEGREYRPSMVGQGRTSERYIALLTSIEELDLRLKREEVQMMTRFEGLGEDIHSLSRIVEGLGNLQPTIVQAKEQGPVIPQ